MSHNCQVYDISVIFSAVFFNEKTMGIIFKYFFLFVVFLWSKGKKTGYDDVQKWVVNFVDQHSKSEAEVASSPGIYFFVITNTDEKFHNGN
jgi:hypothetical protein